MSARIYCDGCDYLDYETRVNRYDVYRALCCDPDKPMMGARRVVATAHTRPPARIVRPVWCRRKERET